MKSISTKCGKKVNLTLLEKEIRRALNRKINHDLYSININLDKKGKAYWTEDCEYKENDSGFNYSIKSVNEVFDTNRRKNINLEVEFLLKYIILEIEDFEIED